MSCIVSLLDVALVALVSVVMERIFKCKSKELVGPLEFEGDGANDGLVGAPAHGHASGSVEQSGAYFISFKVFFEPALLHVPADNLDDVISLIPNFDLVEPVAIPVVTLIDVPAVEVVLRVVVVPEVVGGVDKVGPHVVLTKIYLDISNKLIFLLDSKISLQSLPFYIIITHHHLLPFFTPCALVT